MMMTSKVNPGDRSQLSVRKKSHLWQVERFPNTMSSSWPCHAACMLVPILSRGVGLDCIIDVAGVRVRERLD